MKTLYAVIETSYDTPFEPIVSLFDDYVLANCHKMERDRYWAHQGEDVFIKVKELPVTLIADKIAA